MLPESTKAFTDKEWWLHLFREILHPSIVAKCRRTAQESPKAGGITWSDRIVGFIDGEQAPLDAVEASMDLLEASHMDINKGVPSGTAVGQVLDVSKVFPVAKHYWQLAIQKLHASSSQAKQSQRRTERNGMRFNWRQVYADDLTSMSSLQQNIFVVVKQFLDINEVKLAAGKRKLLLQLFCDLPKILATSLTAANILGGWERTHLEPFNGPEMLQLSSSWDSLTPEFQQYLIQRQPQLIQQARHQGYTLSMQDLTDCMSEEDRKQVQVADSAATHLRPFVMLTAPGEIERRKQFAEARATALKQAAEEKEAAEFARLCHLEEKAIAKEHKAQIQVRKREMAAEDAATKAKLKDDNQNKCGSCRIRWSTEVECGSPWQECEDCKLWWCRVCRGCSCKGGGCKSRACGGGHSTAWISHRDNCAK